MIILAALAHSPAAAQTLTAEQALANHKRSFAGPGAGCGAAEASDPEQIVVCARRTDQSMRLPLPVQPEPGARVRGEAASASAGLQPERCTAWGANQSCSGGLPILPMAVAAVKGAVKIVEAIADPD